MEFLAIGLQIIGYIISLVFGIIIIIKAFQTHVGWGICVLVVPFASLVFVIKYWDKAGKPFLLSLISIPFFAAGFIMMITTIPTGLDGLDIDMEGLETQMQQELERQLEQGLEDQQNQ